MAITGTLKLTLKEDVDIKAFEQMLLDKYADEYSSALGEWDIDNKKRTMEIVYQDKFVDVAREIIERDEVADAFGEFVDDGYEGGDAGEFGYIKENGKAVDIRPEYIQNLSNKDLVSELEKRGFKVTLKEKTKPKDIGRE